MATTASGSGGHPPPTGGQDPKKGFGHQVSNSSIPPSGDGKTPKNAAWSSTLRTTSQTTKTYVVDGLGLVPRYRRTILEEARSFAQIYTILDGDTYQVVAQLPPGPMANPSMPTATGIDQQNVNIAAHENVIATSGGAAAEQYNVAQVHRK
jgi:hypothetical protein